MAAKKKATSKLPPGIPEHAVDQETLMRFFRPPVGRSTFYNLVKKGVIVKLKEVKGYYLLNESLIQLGLQPVSELPADPKAAQREQELQTLAMNMAAPDVEPKRLQGADRLTDPEKLRVAMMAICQQQRIFGFGTWPVSQLPRPKSLKERVLRTIGIPSTPRRSAR